MPWSEADSEKMDEAAATALKELDEWLVAHPKDVNGATWLMAWIEKHYKAAGYKRLCRQLIAHLKVKK